MAISLMIQKASPSVLPLAFRAVSSARSLGGSIFTALNVVDHALASRDSSLQSHQYSTVAVAKKLLDKNLLKVLRSEIKSAKKLEFEYKVPPSPSRFPFAITDNPGERTITLTREFEGETIEVIVEMPPLQDLEVKGNESEDSSDDDETNSPRDKNNEDEGNNNDSESENKDSDSDSDNDDVSDSDETEDDVSSKDNEEKEAPSVPMSVTVSKADGRSLTFEILASSEEIYVEYMSIKEPSNSESKLVEYSGPDFEKLDPELQRSLYKYLEIRGIKLSIAVFLHKYMVNKSQRDGLLWMRKLRKFVKEAKSN